ncbi:hypothetical protein AAG570_010795 [Ranatra chinensis]|uniref:Reverse transcriptase domain-containing protein n=1 Tax=Ranatra chinensis TaxID=642074 RepID=A0ABD0YNK8_9HEMI
MIDEFLVGLSEAFIQAYVDDLIIFGKTIEEHKGHLDKVKRRIQEFGLKISADKSSFFLQKVKFLGHLMSNRVLGHTQGKFKPRSIWELADKIEPMTKLLKKNAISHFNDEAKEALNWCKNALSKYERHPAITPQQITDTPAEQLREVQGDIRHWEEVKVLTLVEVATSSETNKAATSHTLATSEKVMPVRARLKKYLRLTGLRFANGRDWSIHILRNTTYIKMKPRRIQKLSRSHIHHGRTVGRILSDYETPTRSRDEEITDYGYLKNPRYEIRASEAEHKRPRPEPRGSVPKRRRERAEERAPNWEGRSERGVEQDASAGARREAHRARHSLPPAPCTLQPTPCTLHASLRSRFCAECLSKACPVGARDHLIFENRYPAEDKTVYFSVLINDRTNLIYLQAPGDRPVILSYYYTVQSVINWLSPLEKLNETLASQQGRLLNS